MRTEVREVTFERLSSLAMYSSKRVTLDVIMKLFLEMCTDLCTKL